MILKKQNNIIVTNIMTTTTDKKYNLTISDYSKRAFVVRGDTLDFRHDLNDMGGYWNKNLKGGGGYIFSKRRHGTLLDKFIELVNRGKFVPSEIEDTTDHYTTEEEDEENCTCVFGKNWVQCDNCVSKSYCDFDEKEYDSVPAKSPKKEYGTMFSNEKKNCCKTLRNGKIVLCSFHIPEEEKEEETEEETEEEQPTNRSLEDEFEVVWQEDWTLLPEKRAFSNKNLYSVYLPDGSIIVGGGNISSYDLFFNKLGGNKLPNGPWLLKENEHGVATRAFLSYTYEKCKLSPFSRKRARNE